MTTIELLDRIEEIRKLAGDFEAAHAKEDELHQEVLRLIASKEIKGAAVRVYARMALETLHIEFERYCG